MLGSLGLLHAAAIEETWQHPQSGWAFVNIIIITTMPPLLFPLLNTLHAFTPGFLRRQQEKQSARRPATFFPHNVAKLPAVQRGWQGARSGLPGSQVQGLLRNRRLRRRQRQGDLAAVFGDHSIDDALF
ncbi:hypothetical protein CDD83_3410 [Cordyceps sp. RAO-2017]|nr:hypothetical protein CDD83_3410 [Cordyceps sp. RAO-2017]